ncbi:hypothetical protein LL927_05400 [Xanthomonas oryzae]|nr:hypothetical protein LL927_05400 [Xanthomonas oryzae]
MGGADPFIYYRQWQSTGVEDSGLGNDIRNGVLAITALVGLAFGGHWLWKVRSAVAGTSCDGKRPGHDGGGRDPAWAHAGW